MRALLILNSDFGVPNTIGARAKHVAEALVARGGMRPLVLCRGHAAGAEATDVFPGARRLMQFLTAIPIYLSRRLGTNRVKSRIFERALLRKLRRVPVGELTVVHSWDFLPGAYAELKRRNPRIVVVQDVAMALGNALDGLRDVERLWKGEKLSTPDYVKEALTLADIVIAPSEFVKESLMKEGIPASRIEVVPFGVDARKFRPDAKKTASPFRVAFSGNVNNRKGVPYLIEAWKALALPDAELHLYGRVYPEVRPLLSDAKRMNIVIHGFVDIAKELPKNHLYAFPSLLEGSAKSVYEALACGLPVITTRNAGSVVEDGKEGFLIPVRDVQALKEKLLLLYQDRKLLVALGKRARKKAERYTWERYGQEVVEAYREAKKRSGRRTER